MSVSAANENILNKIVINKNHTKLNMRRRIQQKKTDHLSAIYELEIIKNSCIPTRYDQMNNFI